MDTDGLNFDEPIPRLTREQAAIIGAYTGVALGPFSDIQFYGDRLMGRSTWTHEYGDRGFADDLKNRSKQDLLAICVEKP